MRPRLVAIAIFLVALALTAFVDGSARAEHRTRVEAEVAAVADTLVRQLSDAVVQESAAVETLSVFVEIAGEDSTRLAADIPIYAEAMMETSRNILSVQLGPNSILDYVYPVAGNEQAIGLDLMADPNRRALLEPAIASGDTVIQGPVALVQGGVGLIVRSPVYRPNGDFWGFSAIVLDWPGIAADSGLDSLPPTMKAGLRRAGETEVIAGEPSAFAGEPIMRTLRVGATATTWTLAIQPADGWPGVAPTTWTLWVSGLLIGLLAAIGVAQLLGRPAALEAERQKALNDLALAEARYTATFQNAGVGIVVAGRDGSLVSANRAFKRIVGMTAETSAVGAPLSGFVHPEDRPDLEGRLEEVLSVGGVVELDLRLMQGDSQRCCRGQLTRIQHGDASLLIAVVMDVTARRQAEEALAHSEARYRHLFTSAPIAIERQDFSGLKRRLDELRDEGVEDLHTLSPAALAELTGLIRITDANPAATELNRQLESADESVDTRGLESEEARAGFIANLEAIREGAESVSFPISRTTADGRPLHLDLKWQPVPMADGLDYSQVMVTISDVTDLVEAKRGLQNLLDSKDRFLASVAHELRTPLTSIVGFAHELRDNDELSDEEATEFVSLIAQNSVELSHLIEDILVVARSEIGEVSVVPQTIDLTAEATVVLRLLPDHEIRLEAPEQPVLALADPSRIRQILRNLATNAIRYGGEEVSVVVGTVNDRVFVDVCDNGPPISRGHESLIFEPYQKLSSSASVPGSIGLGLTVSLALAQAQGGDISLLRRGDTNVFRMSLPAIAAETKSDYASRPGWVA